MSSISHSEAGSANAFLNSRGVLQAAGEMGWKTGHYYDGTPGYVIPVADDRGQRDRFRVSVPNDWKTRWMGQVGSYVPPVYYPPAIQDAVAAAGGRVILASGEFDLLTFVQVGRQNVFAFTSENSIPPDLADRLAVWNVTHVDYWPDHDEAGLLSGRKLIDTLADSGITINVYSLAGQVNEKGDTNDLWQALDFDQDAFWAALESAPMADLPASTTKKKPNHTTDYNRDDFPVAFVQAVIRRIEEQPKLKKHGDWLNCCSPLREDSNPSFGFNVQKLTWKDFGGGGESGGIVELGRRLGIDIADYYTDSRTYDDGIDLNAAPGEKHGEIRRVNVRYVTELFDSVLAPGAYIIKSQQGTGKTELESALSKHFEAQNHIIRAITPRQAVTGDLARRMECESSNSVPSTLQAAPMTFALTLPSLKHQVDQNGGLRVPHALFLEEVEQLLTFLMSSIIDKRDRMRIFDMLVAMVQGATHVYCFDADAGPVALNFIKSCRADVQVIVNEHQNTDRQLYPYPDKYSLKAALDRAIDKGSGTIAVATSSEKQGKEFKKEFVERLGADKVLLICKDSKTETEPHAFLNMEAGERARAISEYRVIIYTSTMGTGIDISDPTIDAVFGFFDRNPIDAYDMHQMLVRFRKAKGYYVWVSDVEQDFVTDAELLYQQSLKRENRTKTACHFDATGIDLVAQRHDQLARLEAAVRSRNYSSRRNLKQHFFRLAEGRFTVLAERKSISQKQKKDMVESSKERREQLKAEHRAALKAARPVGKTEYNQAANTGQLTPQLEIGRERAIIEETYGETINDQVIDDYGEGRGVGRLIRLESLYLPGSDARAHDYRELSDKIARSDLSHKTMERSLIMRVLAPFMNDRRLDTTITLTSDEINELLQPVIDEHIDDIRTFLKWRNDYDDKPINFLRYCMSFVGLKLVQKKARVGGKVKAIGYRLDPATVQKMERYIEQRRALREEEESPVLPESGKESFYV